MDIESWFDETENNQKNNITFSKIKDEIIKLVDDIIFIQNRVWKDWEIIKVYKVRTINKETEREIPSDSLYWNKQINDPRIIESRKWMRRSWIDELPQIINILKWEMSIFWSRPMSVETFNTLSDSQKERRTKYKPWIFWWYAFYNEWKRFKNRTSRDNQDVYLKIRQKKEKEWKLELFKYNTYIFIKNIKALFNWVNK